MKVGILGSGNVGQALGRGFVSRGHEVMLGSRDAQNPKITEWVVKQGTHARSGTFADVAKFGELIVLATSWTGTQNALRLAGHENFDGKVLIDATNPLLVEQGKPPALAIGHTDSGGERVQRWLSRARVVKCFNIVGNQSMVDPDFPGGPPDMYICGNDADAKRVVTDICHSFGWPNTFDMGGIESSRELESLCILWVKFGFATGAWGHAVKMLRK